ncbi:hypothetical protein ACP70R_012777 [Stipagrostis hirtigluma subsp. patula]
MEPPGAGAGAAAHIEDAASGVRIPHGDLAPPMRFSFQALLMGVNAAAIPQVGGPFFQWPAHATTIPTPSSAHVHPHCSSVLDFEVDTLNQPPQPTNHGEGAGHEASPVMDWGLQAGEEDDSDVHIHPVASLSKQDGSNGDTPHQLAESDEDTSGENTDTAGEEELDPEFIKKLPPNLPPEAAMKLKRCAMGDCGCILQQEMHPVETNEAFKRRIKYPRGQKLPACRPPRSMGAVEIAMRLSPNRTTEHIFVPTPGLTFDFIAEAWEFCNLHSWEVGHGIRKGSKSDKNKMNMIVGYAIYS